VRWEIGLAVAIVIALGTWLVWGPFKHVGLPPARPDARLIDFNLGGARGALELVGEEAAATYRLLYRNGTASDVLSEEEIRRVLPPAVLKEVRTRIGNVVFRILNITGWGSLVWVAIGLLGQGAFFGRMLVQWIASERRRRSVIPEVYWWLSLAGAGTLFVYFAWRQDIVGVLGQSTGFLVYVRNLQLRRATGDRIRPRART